MFTQNVPKAAASEHNKAKRFIQRKLWEGAKKSVNRALDIFPRYFQALDFFLSHTHRINLKQPAEALMAHVRDRLQDTPHPVN